MSCPFCGHIPVRSADNICPFCGHIPVRFTDTLSVTLYV
ncbi:MAG: hypothetical protein II240_06965 [Bacteroidaceae bacterium]|nr:hypothetical protein [Bacteroidaceae bacterium]